MPPDPPHATCGQQRLEGFGGFLGHQATCCGGLPIRIAAQETDWIGPRDGILVLDRNSGG